MTEGTTTSCGFAAVNNGNHCFTNGRRVCCRKVPNLTRIERELLQGCESIYQNNDAPTAVTRAIMKIIKEEIV